MDPGPFRPGKWVSVSGLVHRRRMRFFVGRWETPAPKDRVITLCGRDHTSLIGPAPKGAVVTCGICIKATNTGAHLRR